MINKTEVTDLLWRLPSEIHDVEINYYNALNRLRELKQELAELESDIMKTKKIDGKSDKARALQMIPYTREKQEEIIRAEIFTDCARADLTYKVNLYESVKLIANLL